MHRSSGSLQLSVHLCLRLPRRLHSYWLWGPAVPRSWNLEFLATTLCEYVCKSFYYSLAVFCKKQKKFTEISAPVDCLSLSFLVVQCPALQELENGLTSCGDDEDGEFSFGNSCSFSCHPGYHLVGPTTITCTSAAVWTESAPRCAGESVPTFSSVTFLRKFARLPWLTRLVFHQPSLARTQEETFPSSASAATLWTSCSLAPHAASTAKQVSNCREPRPFSVLGKGGGIKPRLPAKVWKPNLSTRYKPNL